MQYIQNKIALEEAERALQNRALYESRQLRKNKPATNEHDMMVSTLEL